VVVKVHVAPMRRGGAKAARLHLQYIERDGVEKDGSSGILYSEGGPIDARGFGERIAGERHQFRIVLAPEDAGELDLTGYVRGFMAQVERDTGRKLRWAAVNHYNTDNPHAHIVLRGMDRDGQGVRLDRGYVAHGLRWRAQELATNELGPRLERDIERSRAHEVTQERFTSLDRDIAARAQGGTVRLGDHRGRDRALLEARLERLELMRIAERIGRDAWSLADTWKEQLQRLGMRGDIVKEIHRGLRKGPDRGIER
jgi:type IV secretory pathway VirD2 relaxase